MKLIKTKQLSDVLGVSRKSVLERAKKSGWACVEKSGGICFVEEKLPMDIRFALANKQLAKIETTEKVLAGEVFVSASTSAKEMASNRSSLIFAWKQSGEKKQDFIAMYNSKECCISLYEKLGSVSVATFYRWIKDFTDCGASGITPRWGMGRGGAGESLSDIEKDLLSAYWLRSSQPSMQHALRIMLNQVPFSRCTYPTAVRYLNSIPPIIRDYHRLGLTRFENAHLPYMEQNILQYSSLDVVVSDHHCLDCIVMYQGKKIRPWITTFQDYRSGKILGWCTCVTPSSMSIIVAYYLTCYTHGIPKKVLFDNGKDYRSKLLNGYKGTAKKLLDDLTTEETEIMFEGVMQIIGSDVHFTKTYNGKSKGRQEGYFRILAENLAKDIGTYVGSDDRTRPMEAQLMFRAVDGMAQRNDIPEWDSFVHDCNAMVMYINDHFITEQKGCKGMTRSAAFEKFLPETGVRKASKELLQAALSKGEIRRCGRNGIKIKGVNYWHPELAVYSGQDVVVRTSLVFDNKAFVYALNGTFIGECEGNYFAENENDHDASFKRLEGAKKRSLQKIAEIGIKDGAGQENKTMIDIARDMYNQSDFVQIDDVMLPEIEDNRGTLKDQSIPIPSKQKNTTPKYKSPLDSSIEDFMPDLEGKIG